MQRYELEAWLGPVELTPEQFDQLLREANEIEQRHPGEDDGKERQEALIAACQAILGEQGEAETAQWSMPAAEQAINMPGLVILATVNADGTVTVEIDANKGTVARIAINDKEVF